MNNRVKGHVFARSLDASKLSPSTEPQSEYRLVYWPDSDLTSKVFWAKASKKTGYALLYSCKGKTEETVVRYEDLYELYFKTKESTYKLKWSQWERVVNENEVGDTELTAIKGETYVRVLPNKSLTQNEILTRLCAGFASEEEAIQTLKSYGMSVTPLRHVQV